MFKKIMVPLDGSSPAEIALPFAAEISAAFGAETILLSVVESGAAEHDRLYRTYLRDLTDQIQKQLEAWKSKEMVKVSSEILAGEPADEILRYTRENDIHLVVIASRGRSGHGPWFLGNIAAKVLRASNTPVMLVKAGAKEGALEERRPIRKILIPLDGSTVGEQAIPQAEALARGLGAELVLLQVFEPLKPPVSGDGYITMSGDFLREEEERRKTSATAYLEDVEKKLKQRGLAVSRAVLMGSAADLILDYAEAQGLDLIVMSTHGRSGIGRWVFGSVTDKVLHAGQTPVLAVRASAALRL